MEKLQYTFKNDILFKMVFKVAGSGNSADRDEKHYSV